MGFLGITLSMLSHAQIRTSNARIGINHVNLNEVPVADRVRLDVKNLYIQMAWSLYNYPRLSQTEITEAKALPLEMNISGRNRTLPTVELRHSGNTSRPLLVMSAGLFASEWEDLKAAKSFYDIGYDVLKVPTGLSESFVKTFPWIEPGDLAIEAEILIQSVNSYRAKYGIESSGHRVVAYGSSYGGSVVLKAAERQPNFFSRVVSLGPIYDFMYSAQVFDGLMKSAPRGSTLLDGRDAVVEIEQGVGFLMSKDPQTLDSEAYDSYARKKMADVMIDKLVIYCRSRFRGEAPASKCDKVRSFGDLQKFTGVKPPMNSQLQPSQNPRLFVLATANDPLNQNPLPIGHTFVLEKGGHFGFLGTTLESRFLKDLLSSQ
jgi:pimeloyl-ACP methyl ester carboxylesterase